MGDIEKQRLTELFDKVPANEVEAVENAKDCLDACLKYFGKKVKFILFVKKPDGNESFILQFSIQ